MKTAPDFTALKSKISHFVSLSFQLTCFQVVYFQIRSHTINMNAFYLLLLFSLIKKHLWFVADLIKTDFILKHSRRNTIPKNNIQTRNCHSLLLLLLLQSMICFQAKVLVHNDGIHLQKVHGYVPLVPLFLFNEQTNNFIGSL